MAHVPTPCGYMLPTRARSSPGMPAKGLWPYSLCRLSSSGRLRRVRSSASAGGSVCMCRHPSLLLSSSPLRRLDLSISICPPCVASRCRVHTQRPLPAPTQVPPDEGAAATATQPPRGGGGPSQGYGGGNPATGGKCDCRCCCCGGGYHRAGHGRVPLMRRRRQSIKRNRLSREHRA